MAENKEVKMDLRLRPYKGKRPQLGKRVYVDPCATLVGDIELADDAQMKCASHSPFRQAQGQLLLLI
ncbi:hypothetical protein KLNKPBOH_00001 [Aeromonas veronii]